tara:strand:+ start:754 stop:1002 length:249 start_codon:yes stop_codon:yes gene_type:complete
LNEKHLLDLVPTFLKAHALGLGREVGSLEVIKKADLVLFDLMAYRAIPYRLGGHVWKVNKGEKVEYERELIRRDFHDLSTLY